MTYPIPSQVREATPKAPSKQPSSVACLTCRKKHLKCDARMPVCTRCTDQGSECLYLKSRRGGSRKTRAIATPKTDVELHFRNDEEKARDATSSTTGYFDDFGEAADGEDGSVTSWLASATASGSSPNTRNTAASSIEQGSATSMDPTDYEVNDGLISIFYERFFPAHPFVYPRKFYLQRPGAMPKYLKAVMRLVASRHSVGIRQDELQQEVSIVTTDQIPDSAFKVQAYLLLGMYSYACLEQDKGDLLIHQAIDMAVRIGMNSIEFSSSEQDPVVQESWRRTWWECYAVCALLSALQGSAALNVDRFQSMDLDTPLPGSCEAYSNCQPIDSIRSLEDMQDRIFEEEEYNWSSYAYRIEASRILYNTLHVSRKPESNETLGQVEAIDAAISNFLLSLPSNKRSILSRDGVVDEIMFCAHMIIHWSTIILHRPRSALAFLKNHYPTACTGTPMNAIPSSPFELQSHAAKALQAATSISNLTSIRSPLVNHTPCFSCAIAISATVQLPSYLLEDNQGDAQALKERLRLSLSALTSISEVWPIAQVVKRQIACFAREIFVKSTSGVSKKRNRDDNDNTTASKRALNPPPSRPHSVFVPNQPSLTLPTTSNDFAFDISSTMISETMLREAFDEVFQNQSLGPATPFDLLGSKIDPSIVSTSGNNNNNNAANTIMSNSFWLQPVEGDEMLPPLAPAFDVNDFNKFDSFGDFNNNNHDGLRY